MKKINFRIILHLVGILTILNAFFMLLSVGVSLYYKEETFRGLLTAGVISLIVGGGCYFFTQNASKKIQKREGYLIVAVGWLALALFGSLPYLISIPYLDAEVRAVNNFSFTNAIFETISGYTTTGATILNDIEMMPKGLLFWRSLTHWIGGMGIIVLTIAILPLLGIGGMQLFVAEAPGINADKLHPRITSTAKRLWMIYLGATILQAILLKLAGMGYYDAINHALSTLSTGGFSTKNTSLAYWNDNPLVQYIVIFFMFFAGTNFILNYYILKGKFVKVWRNEEFKFYAFVIGFISLLVSMQVYIHGDPSLTTIEHPSTYLGLENKMRFSFEGSVRHALFQVLSVVTTTGFVTADFSVWPTLVALIFFFLLFFGGSAGSTSGGMKLVRHLILIKNGNLEFKRLLHPNAVLPVRYNNKAVGRQVVYNILAFAIIYIAIFVIGSVLMTFIEHNLNPSNDELISCVSVVASSLGNVGPALGRFSPVDNYASLSMLGKWLSSFLMLLGRLELFTLLIVLSPAFWKKS